MGLGVQMTTKEFAVFGRAAGAVGEISRSRLPLARQACAVAPGRARRRLSEGQRRDLPRPGKSQSAAARAVAARHGLGRDRRARPARQECDDRRSIGPAGPAGRHGRDRCGPGAAVSDLVRRGVLSGARSGCRLCAGPRLQRLDRRFLQVCAAAAFRRRDVAAAGHGLRAGGIAAGGAHVIVPRRLHPADVHRRPLLEPSLLRPAVGGAGAARDHRGGAFDARAVEPGMDLARPVLR